MTVLNTALFLFILFNMPVIGRLALWFFNTVTNVLMLLLCLAILVTLSVFLKEILF